MSRKIIYILCHTLDNDSSLEYHVFGNWSARAAKDLVKNTNKYNVEVWYAINNLNEKRVYVKKKVTYKLFPATTLNKMLESFFGIISSPELLKDLQKENPRNTIIHFQGERGSLIHTILKNHPQFEYVIQYHGYGQPWWLNWMENLFLVPLEKKTFPLIEHFFVHIQRRIKYLEKKIKIPPQRISFQNVGVDFERFKPRNKNEARAKLGLPKNRFIMLYVGKIVKTKGADKIIEAYRILKKEHKHLYLLFIGAQQDDPLFKKAEKDIDKIVETISNEDLPLYYSASDVYCFYGDKKTIQYAGVGTAPTEALASNMNVISTNLIHIPGYENKKIGFIPKNLEDFLSKIRFLILHPNFRFNPRELAASYTSYNHMTKNLIHVYDKIFSRKN